MSFGFRIPSRRARFALAAAGLAVLAVAVLGARQAPVADMALSVCTTQAGMTEAQMMDASVAHYLARPAHGYSTTAVAAVTVYVRDYQFDADNNPLTQVDVVHISAGQSVLFQWLGGVHTTTNGVDYLDPAAGTLWDVPLNVTNQQAIIPFPTPGTYPYFCQFHGDLANMVGTVVVDAATPTKSTTWGRVKAHYR